MGAEPREEVAAAAAQGRLDGRLGNGAAWRAQPDSGLLPGEPLQVHELEDEQVVDRQRQQGRPDGLAEFRLDEQGIGGRGRRDSAVRDRPLAIVRQATWPASAVSARLGVMPTTTMRADALT